MTFLRRFRSPIIALVAVVFSATIVLAGQPAPQSSSGLANAASHAGKTVPTASDGQSSQDETTETETNDGTENSSDSADNCNVDLTGDLSGFSHGQIVCSAAHSSFDTATYANRGAWVSHWAKQNHGADASATGKSHQPSH